MASESNILIVGGGLAGLSLAILLAQKDYKVQLWEKGAYPRHKVCGEFISTESLPFLERLGLGEELAKWPSINRFFLTSEYGYAGECNLKIGGVGVSRFHLDHLLYEKALACGVKVLTHSTVKKIRWDGVQKEYEVKSSKGVEENFHLVIGSFGRINGLLPLNMQTKKYLGVKYHIAEGPARDTMEMHHFEGGYCGVSAIEGQHFCLCYLVDVERFKPFGGDIERLEDEVLSTNQFLKKRLSAARLFQGVRTAHIAFGTTSLDEISYPLTGDALGFIPPITGNGMSLAFRSAAYLLPLSEAYLNGKISRLELIQEQRNYAQQYLQKRIKRGVFLHNLITNRNPLLQRTILKGLTQFSGLMRLSAKMAVGDSF
jgi:flavin-dependent dehydrogenase